MPFVRLLAVANMLWACFGFVQLARELYQHGFATTTESGLATVISVTGLVALPLVLVAGLGRGLWRFDRAAWVGQVGAGVIVPMVSMVCLSVGLAPGPLRWLFVALAAYFVLSAAVLLSRAARWSFGIGPDAVLAEIDARGEAELSELARAFSTSEPLLAGLLERCIADHAFTGAWDREGGKVYSLATLLTREELRRCPRCGGAVDAFGRVGRCRYCGIEFGQIRGLDASMPLPIGLAVVAALDNAYASVCAFLAVTWAALFLTNAEQTGGTERVVWLLFVALPLALSFTAIAISVRLREGRRWAWKAQMLLMPPAAVYLLSRRVRLLFASSLETLRTRLDTERGLPIAELAGWLGVKERYAVETAIYLTATHTLDAVVDWSARRLVHRGRLGVDGRTHCHHCGAPLRLGGVCMFCGTSVEVPRGTPVVQRKVSGGSVSGFVVVCTLIAGLFALASSGSRANGSGQAGPSTAPAPAPAIDTPFVPVADDYDATRKEVAWVGGGIQSLAFDPQGRLLSGEQNGLFLWDVAQRTRSLRLPAELTQYAGVRWMGFGLNDEIVFGTSGATVVHGSLDARRITAQRSYLSLLRRLQKEDAGTVMPSTLALARSPSGRVLAALQTSSLHLYELHEMNRLVSIAPASPSKIIAAALSSDGARLAVLFRDPTPQSETLGLSYEELLEVWNVETRQRMFQRRQRVRTNMVLSQGQRIAFDPNGNLLTIDDRAGVRLWDLGSRRARTVETPEAIESSSGPVAFTANGSRLALVLSGPPKSGVDRGIVYEVGAASLKQVESFDVQKDESISALALDASGRLLVVGDTRGRVRFVEFVRD